MNRTIPVDIRFRHMPGSRELKSMIRRQVQRLRRFGLANGARCEVIIDESNHWGRGRLFRVMIHLTLPGAGDIAVRTKEMGDDERCVDPSVILAFDEIERQLQKKRVRTRRRHRLGHHGVAA